MIWGKMYYGDDGDHSLPDRTIVLHSVGGGLVVGDAGSGWRRRVRLSGVQRCSILGSLGGGYDNNIDE